MSKQRNDNIGHITCLINGCHSHAAVRRNRSGKYYFDCPDHGRICPNLPEGQAAIMDHANIWGPEGPPPECARWIAEQWSWGQVMRNPEARKPVNGESPVTEPAPVNEPAPFNGPAMPPEPPTEPLGKPAGSQAYEPAPDYEPGQGTETEDEDEDEFA